MLIKPLVVGVIQIFVTDGRTEEELRILAVGYLGDTQEVNQIKYIRNTHLLEKYVRTCILIILMKDALLSLNYEKIRITPLQSL